MLTPTQRDRSLAAEIAELLGDPIWIANAVPELMHAHRLDGHPLVQAFAQHAANAIEQAARVIKGMADEARYREQIGSEDMEVEHGAAADALCDAYAALIALNTDTKDGRDG